MIAMSRDRIVLMNQNAGRVTDKIRLTGSSAKFSMFLRVFEALKDF
jgi:hypothetical protein